MPNTALEQMLERLLTRLDARVSAPVAPDWKNVRAARWSALAGGLKPQRTGCAGLEKCARGALVGAGRWAETHPAPTAGGHERSAGHRRAKAAGRCQHASVRCRQARQQRAADGCARQRQVLPGESGARQIRAQGAATDRGGQGRPAQPARPVRSAGGRRLPLHGLHRRPHLCRTRTRLCQPQGRARRLAGRAVRQRADLRHQQPSSPDAGIHGRKSGDPTPRRRGASGRLWVSFHVMDQDTYLDIARHWATQLGAATDEKFERAALQWSLGRGARNGRVAWQFARDWAGRQ